MLAADAVVYGDGGGEARRGRTPIVGARPRGRLLAGVGGQIGDYGLTLQLREVNGQPGAVVRDADGRS